MTMQELHSDLPASRSVRSCGIQHIGNLHNLTSLEPYAKSCQARRPSRSEQNGLDDSYV